MKTKGKNAYKGKSKYSLPCLFLIYQITVSTTRYLNYTPAYFPKVVFTRIGWTDSSVSVFFECHVKCLSMSGVEKYLLIITLVYGVWSYPNSLTNTTLLLYNLHYLFVHYDSHVGSILLQTQEAMNF